MSQPTDTPKTIFNMSDAVPALLKVPKAAETTRADAGHPECPKCGHKHSASYSEKVVENFVETTNNYLQCLNCGNRFQAESKKEEHI